NYKQFNNLIDLLSAAAKPKKEGGACHNKNRVAILNDVVSTLKNPPMDLTDYEHEIYRDETELLGIALTCNELDGIKAYTNCQISDFLDGLSSHKLRFVAAVKRMTYYTIKAGPSAGEEMAFLTLADSTGEV